MRKLYPLLFLLFSPIFSNAQSGCTDTQASNYNPSATQNDGSCFYPMTNYSLQEIAQLPDEVNEISGLLSMDTSLWAQTDTQGDNWLYKLDTLTGALRKHVVITNAANMDWEELAEDETHVYVGDFGNNTGNRQDLSIYIINKQDLDRDTAFAKLLTFQFSDQLNYMADPTNETDFDCEAFFYANDSLHLFSKNWVDNKTRHYVLPAVEGSHTAQLVESFNVNGLITAADISEDNVISLLGYTNSGANFLWLLYDYKGTQFFSGNKRRIELGSGLINGKTEGLAFRQMNSGYITSENFEQAGFRLPPKLYAFDLSAFFEKSTAVENHSLTDFNQWEVAPNPFYAELKIFTKVRKEKANLYLYDGVGRLILESRKVYEVEWNTDRLDAGVYFLQIQSLSGYNQVIKIIKPL